MSIQEVSSLRLNARPAAASSTRQKTAAGPQDGFQATASTDFKGYDLKSLDPTVRPQDNFYNYAVGGYIKAHPIPADKDSTGIRSELTQRITETLRNILEEAAALPNAVPGSVEQKIGDFYASGMNTAAIEAAGASPLDGEFQRINAVKNTDDLTDEMAHLHASGFGALFSFGASQDMKNPENVIGEASQGGLGLSRDYYVKDDDRSKKILAAYQNHAANMFVLLGDSPEKSQQEAATVVAMERRLAQGSLSHAQLRDPQALYHIMDRADLARMTPNFSWERYFKGVGRPDIQKINVATPKFFDTMNQMVQDVPTDDWKTYMRWHVIHQSAASLSSRFETEDFNFRGKVLSGIPTMPERWKKIVRSADSNLGEAVGQKFVERTFPPEAKARALDMVNNIKSVLRERITTLPWMGTETRKEALNKIDRLRVKIGYPDHWKDYSDLKVDRGVYADNILRSWQFDATNNLRSIGKPVDRDAWQMTPATVNAYYEPTLNEIVFPAARLQPPFFDPKADDATNYGATGATIGHEMTHGFDDSGAQFDSGGHLQNWWQPEDKARFTTLADGVEHQFDEFVYDGQKVTGKLVEGEALADQGGVELSHAALMKSLAQHPETTSPDGFTPEQRFFLSYALCREEDQRPESAHEQITNDPHPLGEFRVNAPLSNMPAFYAAFGVQPQDPMMRAEVKRNHLWDSPQK